LTVTDVAVVGAGPSGLACARGLLAARKSCVVLERSRGVGGRCATRRVQGQPVDHGLAFLHGSDPGFVSAIRDVPGATPLEGWPRRVEGHGAPCLPKAYGHRELRLAYAEGLTAFPKALANGVDVRLGTEAAWLAEVPGGVRIGTLEDRAVDAASVVLALPAPVSRRLLESLHPDGREFQAVGRLLGQVGTQACLTVLAGYPVTVPSPPWDVLYPDLSDAVQIVSQDSTKRPAPDFLVLVVQARPCWSLARFEDPDAAWSDAILRETARIVGPWAGRPAWMQAHRWRFARADRGSEMTRPLSLRLPRGGRIVVTGESFAPGGGVEAAWLAGNACARRLIEED
jgi:renalase